MICSKSSCIYQFAGRTLDGTTTKDASMHTMVATTMGRNVGRKCGRQVGLTGEPSRRADHKGRPPSGARAALLWPRAALLSPRAAQSGRRTCAATPARRGRSTRALRGRDSCGHLSAIYEPAPLRRWRPKRIRPAVWQLFGSCLAGCQTLGPVPVRPGCNNNNKWPPVGPSQRPSRRLGLGRGPAAKGRRLALPAVRASGRVRGAATLLAVMAT